MLLIIISVLKKIIHISVRNLLVKKHNQFILIQEGDYNKVFKKDWNFQLLDRIEDKEVIEIILDLIGKKKKKNKFKRMIKNQMNHLY